MRLEVRPESDDASAPLITAPARALMDALGITDAQVAALGVPVVRRGDIEGLRDVLRETLREASPASDTVEISRVQQAVGRAVREPHETTRPGRATAR